MLYNQSQKIITMLNFIKKIKPIALLIYVFSSVVIADDSFDIQFSDISIKIPAGSMSPHLSTSKSNITILNWLEPTDDGHRIQFSKFDSGWTLPSTVTNGNDWFINWADFPSVINFNQNEYAAHWLKKSGESTYAYDTYISISKNNGKSWSQPIKAHEDKTQTEHGFLSFYEHKNELGFIYLDGRKMANKATHDKSHSSMSLRSGSIDRNLNLNNTQNIDGLVCECCQTDITVTDRGPIGVYRDRSEEEYRDIYITKLENDSWTVGKPLHLDNWKINGCPVNGPVITGNSNEITVAWYTRSGGKSNIKIAKSFDYGETFNEPLLIGTNETVGHISMTTDNKRNTWLLWQKTAKKGLVELVLTKIEPDSNQIMHKVIEEAGKSPRFSFPQIIRNGETIILAYTTVINDSRKTRGSNRKTSIKSLSFNANLY